MRPAPLIAAVIIGVLFVVAGEQVPTIVVSESWGFVITLPFAIGFVALRFQKSPGRLAAILLPWLLVLLIASLVYFTKRASALGVAMALPVGMLGASMGGLVARTRAGQGRAWVEGALAVLLPIAMMALELRVSPVAQEVESTSSVEIAASASRVWDEVVEVDSISADGNDRALLPMLGVPSTVAASLDYPQEAGARVLQMDRGRPVDEVVVQWEPERRLVLAVLPTSPADSAGRDGEGRTEAHAPDTALLTDTYDLEKLDAGRTRLRMTNATRVTSRLGLYATWWARTLLGSAQQRVLGTVQRRSEDGARASKERIRAATAARALREQADERTASSIGMFWSVVGAMTGRTDVYADSVVALVRDGELVRQHTDGPQALDSVTASLASGSGNNWSPGAPSRAMVLEWRGREGEHKALGPMVRFSIPREAGASLDGRWVVFTYHLTVPKSNHNPYGTAWTYTHTATGGEP